MNKKLCDCLVYYAMADLDCNQHASRAFVSTVAGTLKVFYRCSEHLELELIEGENRQEMSIKEAQNLLKVKSVQEF